MIKWLFILLFPFAACGQTEVLGVISGSGPSGTPIVTAGKTFVDIADSYGAGNWVRSVKTMADSLAQLQGSTADNRSVSGSLVQTITACGGHTTFNLTGLPTYNSSYSLYYLRLGTNDIQVNISGLTAVSYQAALEDAIDYLHDILLVPYKRIVVVTPYYTQQAGRDLEIGSCSVVTGATYTRLTDHVTAAIAAATSKGTQLLNIFQTQIDTGNPDALMGSDGLHPNFTTGPNLIIDQMNTTFYE